MAPLTLALSFLFIFFGSHALAGSHAWQPALVPRNDTSRLGKRYYYATQASGVRDRLPWPDRKIRYCFKADDADTQSHKADFKKYLRDAHKLWIAQGLNADFKIEEVSDTACTEDRNNVLEIRYSSQSIATYVGFPGATAALTANTGPVMVLTDRTDVGLLDVVSNFAHELGHAWGLYHEHQNPNFWADVAGSNAGEVWGPNNPGGWNCVNLKDYTSVQLDLIALTQNSIRTLTMDQLCSNYGLASLKYFSASDYLPMPNVGVAHTSGHGSDAVDWTSLMLYPSGAGGIPSGDGTVTADNDIRLPILLKPDGSRIPINTAPSALDVAALHALYANTEGTSSNQLLTGLTNFKKVFKNSGSGPSSGSGCL